MTNQEIDPVSAGGGTARYEQKLTRSLTLRGNILITLSSVKPDRAGHPHQPRYRRGR